MIVRRRVGILHNFPDIEVAVESRGKYFIMGNRNGDSLVNNKDPYTCKDQQEERKVNF